VYGLRPMVGVPAVVIRPAGPDFYASVVLNIMSPPMRGRALKKARPCTAGLASEEGDAKHHRKQKRKPGNDWKISDFSLVPRARRSIIALFHVVYNPSGRMPANFSPAWSSARQGLLSLSQPARAD
jgi:hypothetical protein